MAKQQGDAHRRSHAVGRARRHALTVLMLSAAVISPSTLSANAAPACAGAAPLGHGWSVLATPPFTQGPAPGARFAWPVAIIAAVPGTGDVLLATNGTQILRSANSGCTWNPVYSLAEGYLGHDPAGYDDQGLGGSYAIVSFGAPRYGQARSVYAFAAVEGLTASTATQFVAAPPILILKSADAGVSWQTVTATPSVTAPAVPRCSNPLAPETALRAAVASSDPNTLYLVCPSFSENNVDGAIGKATLPGDPLVYESTDGGSSWMLRTGPTTRSGGVPAQGLAIDSKDPSKVWLVTINSSQSGPPVYTPTLWYSPDSGVHWVSRATGGQVRDPSYGSDANVKSSVARLGEFGVDSAPTAGVAALARGSFGALQVASSSAKSKSVAWRVGAIAVHAIYGPNEDLYVVQDFGVPAGYGAPYCDNVSSSWEHLTRYRNGKSVLLPSPGRLVADFYGLQSAGTARTAIYGYGKLWSNSSTCSSVRNVLLSWKSER